MGLLVVFGVGILGLGLGTWVGWALHGAEPAARPIKSSSPPADDVEPDVRGKDAVAKLLRRCSQLKTPATVLSTSTGALTIARFSGLSADQVVLDVLEEGAARMFRPPALVCVQFNALDKGRVFLGVLHAVDSSENYPKLRVARPHHVVAVESRMAFRAPVSSNSGLTVLVGPVGGGLRKVTVRDISRLGVGVEFDDDALDVPAGLECNVKLELEDKIVKMKGSVRRRQGRFAGIVFFDVLSDGDVRIPAALSYIVGELERVYMAQRRAGRA